MKKETKKEINKEINKELLYLRKNYCVCKIENYNYNFPNTCPWCLRINRLKRLIKKIN